MTGLWAYPPPPLPVRVADPVTDRAEIVHDGLTIAEDGLEHRFLVLVRGKVQLLGGQRPQLRQIGIVGVCRLSIVEDMLADGLQECPRRSDRALRVIACYSRRMIEPRKKAGMLRR